MNTLTQVRLRGAVKLFVNLLIKGEEAGLFSRLYLASAIIRAFEHMIVPVKLGPCLGASSIGVLLVDPRHEPVDRPCE